MSELKLPVDDKDEIGFATRSIPGGSHYVPTISIVMRGLAGVSSEVVGTMDYAYLTGTMGNDELRGEAEDDQIYGLDGDDVLRGAQGNDILIGGAGDDKLYGGKGDDQIDGGSGADRMVGKDGNDIYIVDNPYDTVIENYNDGYDTLATYVDYDIPLYIEEIIAIGENPVELNGNDLDNILVGNSKNNVLTGRKGSDYIVAGDGNDIIVGNKGKDVLVGMDGNDNINGGKGSDIMNGGPGNDSLHGNRGADVFFGGEGENILWGGKGSDVFVVDCPGIQLDIIYDFEIGQEGDRIVVNDELIDADALRSNLDGYVQMAGDSESTTIAIDVDGGADSFVVVARLQNLSSLLSDGLVVADDGSLTISPGS